MMLHKNLTRPLLKRSKKIEAMNHQITEYNAALRNKSALEIIHWGIERADGRAIVTTNFGPFEAVILHLCTQVQPDMPVLWIDHGYNRPATYRFAEKLSTLLNLNLRIYIPKLTAAHRDAIYGPIPDTDDEEKLLQFSKTMKLEPFSRGMKELAPKSGSQHYAKYKILIEPDWILFPRRKILTPLKSVLFSIGPILTWRTISDNIT